MVWHSGSWVDKDLRKLCTSFNGMFYSVSAQAFHALRTGAGGCGAPQAAMPVLLRGLAVLVLLQDRTGEVLAEMRVLLCSVSYS